MSQSFDEVCKGSELRVIELRLELLKNLRDLRGVCHGSRCILNFSLIKSSLSIDVRVVRLQFIQNLKLYTLAFVPAVCPVAQWWGFSGVDMKKVDEYEMCIMANT